MKTSDNRGFSLIELLIAVCVLAIVVVPMLHSFVSSHRINAKSKQYMRATTLAQDEMEIFEREDLESLMDTSKHDYTVTGPDSNGCYEFVRENISNDHSGASASRFDVSVKLDPERAASSDRYYDTNNQELFYMNTIGSADSAVYVQNIRNATNPKSFDDTIYEYFSANKSPVGGGSSWDIDKFNENIARRIKIRIYKENTGLNEATIVKVTYEYVMCKDNVMPSGYQFYSEESVIFNNSAQGVDEEGKLPELKNVYLFYAPRYRGYSSPQSVIYPAAGGERYSTNEDWIYIENEAKLPVNVYIIRQDILKDGSNTDIEDTPVGYKPRIDIIDGVDAEDHTIGHYFTNLNIDDSPAVGLGAQIDFSHLKNIDNMSRVYSDAEARTVIDPKPLDGAGSAQTEVKDRIYSMTVQVYSHGVDRSSASPIVTMTGSKLE